MVGENTNYLFRRNRSRDSLDKALSFASSDKLVASIWHLMAIKNGRSELASYFSNFPPEALTNDPTSKYHIWPWMLESILNRGLAVRKRARPRNGRYKELRLQDFNAIAKLINLQHQIENFEAGLFITQENVILSLYRLTHRQFPWQRGFVKSNILLRYFEIYFCDESEQVFERLYGIKFRIFLRFSYILFSQFLTTPYFNLNTDLRSYGLDDVAKRRCCKLISLSLKDAQEEAQRLLGTASEAGYHPSLLRKFPCLMIGDLTNSHLVCPFPDLLFNRMTEGIFYDFTAANESLSNTFSKRFEQYCIRLMRTKGEKYEIGSESEYGTKKKRFRTPDVLLTLDGRLLAIIECKARKLGSATLTSQDPLRSSSGFEELAYGIFQLWRFFHHSRTGQLSPENCASADTCGVLLTLDPWLESSDGFSEALFERARVIEAEKGEAFQDCDRRKVTFMTAFDLDTILSRGNVDDLLTVIAGSKTPEFMGWMPLTIFDTIFKDRKRRAGSIIEPSPGLIETLPWLADIGPAL